MSDENQTGDTLLGGRYRLLRRLGAGGMGTVYLAQDERLRREVAVKILTESSDDVETDRYYFHREARAVAALDHSGVVRIFDYSGPHESPPYIVMELLNGKNLADTVGRRPCATDAVVMALAALAADALAHAHARDVIHRDIKPANIMALENGRLVITDFGLAKAYVDPKRLGGTVAQRATRLYGTPNFMAPEQVRDDDSGPYTDVFSLGSVLYWLATGTPPFNAETAVDILRHIVDNEHAALTERRPDLSSETCELVENCLTQDLYTRPTAATIAQHATTWLAQHGLHAERVLAPLIGAGAAVAPADLADDSLDAPTAATPDTDTDAGRCPPAEDPILSERTLAVRPPSADEAPSLPPANGQPAVADAPPAVAPTRRSPRDWAHWPGVAAVLGIGVAWMLQRDVTPAVVEKPTPVQPVVVAPAPAPVGLDTTTLVETPVPAQETVPTPAAPRTRAAIPSRTNVRSEAETAPGGKTSTVALTVRPWGKVYLDGQYVGNTPIVRTLQAANGVHTVMVEHPRFGRHQRKVTFGHEHDLTIDLTAP